MRPGLHLLGLGPLTICPSHVSATSNSTYCPSRRIAVVAVMVSVPLALANRPVPPVIVMIAVPDVWVPVTVYPPDNSSPLAPTIVTEPKPLKVPFS